MRKSTGPSLSRPPAATPASEAWKFGGALCATCGSEPTGKYRDGSPSFGCYDPATHKPMFPPGVES